MVLTDKIREITEEEKEGFKEYARETSEQVLLDELGYDIYGYDLRNWDERGITEESVREKYENCDKKGVPVISASRYFALVFPTLKIGFKTDVEKVIEIIMSSKEKNWKELKRIWLNDLKQGLKIYFEDPGNPNKDHLRTCYEEYRRYCELLNENPLSKRQIYNSVKKIL
jgi:hypothetical protein